MKKKVLQILGIAAALTLGTALTSFAGWVDGDYYVGDNGQKIVNDWCLIDNSWRYFGANGRVYKDGLREIDGVTYHFTETVMDTGWVKRGNFYYHFDASGAMQTGWQQLTDRENPSAGICWYYFDNDGKMLDGVKREIGGERYIFDANGRMLTGWVYEDDHTSRNADDWLYFEASGAAANGWEQTNYRGENETCWFYFIDGKPYTASYKTKRIGSYGIAKIGSEHYCFDEEGRMIVGLYELESDRYYYFNSDGEMETGKTTVKDGDETIECYFETQGNIGQLGRGITGVKGGKLYEYGMLVAADKEDKYDIVTVAGKDYLVSNKGTVKTSGTVRDGNDTKYQVTQTSSGNYVITIVPDED